MKKLTPKIATLISQMIADELCYQVQTKLTDEEKEKLVTNITSIITTKMKKYGRWTLSYENDKTNIILSELFPDIFRINCMYTNFKIILEKLKIDETHLISLKITCVNIYGAHLEKIIWSSDVDILKPTQNFIKVN